MKRKHLAYLLVTTLLAAPAMAQTGVSPGSTPAAPSATDAQRGGTPGMNTGAAGVQGGAMSGATLNPSNLGLSVVDVNRALAAPGVGQMMATDIRGTRVYGANNENVGDISDILLSREGHIVALVVGVSGFLGIGQKDVAVSFKAFDFVADGQTSATRTSTSTSTTSTSASPGATGTSSRTATDPTSNMGPSTGLETLSTRAPGASGTAATPGTATGTASGSSAGAPSVSGTTSSMADSNRTGGSGSAVTGSTPGATSSMSSQQTAGLLKPERIVLRGMTKADLEAAPLFQKTAASTSAPR